MSIDSFAIYSLRRGPYLISTDRDQLDLDVIHGFLTRCYWAEGISRENVARSIEQSLPFGAYAQGSQIGFARVITDFTTFAYLADVFVLPAYRGNDVGALLIEGISSHPELQGVRTWLLFTRDAHGLYRKFGFEVTHRPERIMERPRSATRPPSEA